MTKYYQLRRTFSLAVLFTLFSVAAFAQKMITGTVTSAEDNEPIPGANVLIKGTASGTITDFNGAFQLEAADSDVLVVSFVGFTPQEVTVGSQTKVDVQLATDVTSLEEVVVIGYGSAKKEDLTGSIQSINASDFNQGAITSPQELLNGKVAGVQITTGGGAPGAGATIRIRGGSSLSASSDPLIVIDGVPIDNGEVSGMPNPLSTINPNDIETFTVLKDASATAIYGSRASNGVILITTKKGTKDFTVSYTGNVQVSTPMNTVDVLNASEYQSVVNERYGEENRYNEFMGIAGENGERQMYNTNWQDQIFQTAVSTEHNVAVGGTLAEVLPYRVSVGYNHNEGVLKSSSMDRTTVGVNLTPKFFDDHLKVSVNAKYSNIANQFADAGAIGAAVAFDPTKPIHIEDQKYGGYFGWEDADGAPNILAPANPVALLEQKSDKSSVNRFIGNMTLDYKFHFLPDLKANLNLGYDHSKSDGNVYIDPLGVFDVESFNKGGYHSWFNQTKKNELLDFYLQYNKDISAIDSRIEVMGGYSWQHFWWEKLDANEFADGTHRGDTDVLSRSENYLVSFFGRANFNFKERLNLTATLRQDGSSRFVGENQWGLFPSFAASYNFKKDGWLKNSSAVSSLKFRAGWGVTGQQDVGSDYPAFGTYSRGLSSAQYVYYSQDGVGTVIPVNTLRPNAYDANLKWETTTTTNVAFDYGFMDEKLTGSVDVYYRETTDLLNQIPVAAGTNFRNQVITNVGSMVNKGVEFSINYRAIQTSDFNWNMSFNATRNFNEITKLTAVDDPNYKGVLTGGIEGPTGQTAQIHATGHTAYSYYVYQQVYDENGRPLEDVFVDRNGDGQINEDDKYISDKNATPDWMLGFSSNMTYKNWDFSFALRANLGVYNYNNVASQNGKFTNVNTGNTFVNNLHRDIYNTGFNGNLDEDRFYQSDYFIQKADFLRMDNIMVGYNFFNVMGSKMNARVYATVNNAFVITPYEGIDPEVFGGMDNNFYPRPRTYLLGVNLTF
ncbi:TonB-dependent receptor [Persicobacter diffluens]|uniref:SusC/RagA family TonB-linked outer membrane protein n=1 Tax=Persicobacter diffluens TaxID=981 RepID=A0AAN4VU27_9BACT|nr:SusC/RagA family TonB-linked outer membrane protein [Persicobacter diffluens]